MSGKFMKGMLAVTGLLVIAGGGWFISMLEGQQRQLVHQLSESRMSLAKREETVTLLEEERGKLAKSYETLKARWEQCDQGLQQLTKNSEQLKNDLASLSNERVGMQQRFDEAKEQRNRLEQQLGQLKQEIATKEADRTALESKFQTALRTIPSRDDMARLTKTLVNREEEQHRLSEGFADVSRAYEELVQQIHAEEQQAAQLPIPPAQGVHVQRSMPVQETAQFYRRLGGSYMAARQYPQAAEAFERSVALQDDAFLHAKLAFIYGQLLHDAAKARYHMAFAPSIDPVRAGLDDYAAAEGYPRKGWRLMWQWLSGK